MGEFLIPVIREPFSTFVRRFFNELIFPSWTKISINQNKDGSLNIKKFNEETLVSSLNLAGKLLEDFDRICIYTKLKNSKYWKFEDCANENSEYIMSLPLGTNLNRILLRIAVEFFPELNNWYNPFLEFDGSQRNDQANFQQNFNRLSDKEKKRYLKAINNPSKKLKYEKNTKKFRQTR